VAFALEASAADRFSPLDLRDVKVGGEFGRRIAVTVTNNLFKLDADRDFLPPFREKTGKTGYIGLGKLIDSAVKFAAYSGDARALALKRHLVEELLKTQEPDGYMGTFPPDKRIKTLWDVSEMGYLIDGLVSDHRFFGEGASLAAARKAADYLVRNWSLLPTDWVAGDGVALDVGLVGIERNMLSLYQAAGEPAYLDFVVKTRKLPEWDAPIVIGRKPGIEGHVYGYLAPCLAQLDLHRLRPDARLPRATERALGFMTRGDGMLITGSSGHCEIWTDDQDGRGDVGETCALAYAVRVCESRLRASGEAKLGDLMERVIFNAFFASQSPDGRRLRYFAPLEGPRAYWDTDTYCCPCNYRRIVAELPSMVFYRAGDGLAVSLYSPAEARLTVAGNVPLKVRQETTFPNDGKIRIALDPAAPATFALRLRIPAWAAGASVAVNGAPAPGTPAPGAFFEIRREWRAGDSVALDLPMRWRLVLGRQRQAGRVAVMRGPLVFCLNPSQNPDLAKLDAADLGYIALDPESLADPVPETSVRPDGIGCRVRAWKAGFGLSQATDYEFTLSEFPDPGGRAAYFRLRDYRAAVRDELLSCAATAGAAP
jgi:DUF1680 family protein